jgi:hypothetical protein
MSENTFFKERLYFTALVSIAIWSLLAWNYYHGGVPSHSILARADMPSISNWWGALVLPVLTWLLLYRVQRRLANVWNENSNFIGLPNEVVYGFAGALLFGITLSTVYALGYKDIPGYMVNSIFIMALFFPIYRAECLLGFVIGMTFTFGAVLPTGIGSIFALIGAVLYLGVRSLLLKFVSASVPDKQQ